MEGNGMKRKVRGKGEEVEGKREGPLKV